MLRSDCVIGVLLTSTLFGCSSTRIEATVRDARGPVQGVEVGMDCPQVIKAGGVSPFGRTDASGRLDFREPGGGRWIHDGCVIVVGDQRFPVESVCKEYSGNHCIHAVVEAAR